MKCLTKGYSTKISRKASQDKRFRKVLEQKLRAATITVRDSNEHDEKKNNRS
jgi:thioredoxin-related protein